MLGRVWGPLAVHRLTCRLMGKQLPYLDFRFTILNVGITFLPLTLQKECGGLLSHGFECTLAYGGQKKPRVPFTRPSTLPFKTGLSVAQSSSRRLAGVGTVIPSELSVCLSSLGITNTLPCQFWVFLFLMWLLRPHVWKASTLCTEPPSQHLTLVFLT